MKKKTAKQKRNLPDKTASYEATAKVLGKVYNSSGDTISSAIENLSVQGRGIAVLTVTKGESTKTKILAPLQTFRLWQSGRVMREVALKNISALFYGL